MRIRIKLYGLIGALLCLAIGGSVYIGIGWHHANATPEKPKERLIDLSGEVMRIYGFEQGELTIIAPHQMVTIDGVHYIYAYDPKLDTDKMYCIRENSWLYYTFYFMPEDRDGLDFKEFEFEF